jgi:hypothetical protein
MSPAATCTRRVSVALKVVKRERSLQKWLDAPESNTQWWTSAEFGGEEGGTFCVEGWSSSVRTVAAHAHSIVSAYEAAEVAVIARIGPLGLTKLGSWRECPTGKPCSW